jgi:parallel beta-helix repeat protein
VSALAATPPATPWTTPAGNTSAGIFVNDSSGNTFSDNLIRFNQVGIALQTPLPPQVPGLRNQLLGNRISSNTNLGIDLGWNGVTANDAGDGDAGANNYQNFPVITDATNTSSETQVSVDLSSFAGGSYTLQFFSSATCDPGGYGEGEQLVATFLATAPGSGSFSLPLTPAGHAITATATDTDGNTSEFSACAIVNGTVVTNAGDSGAGSLRAAIANANSIPGTQTITFDIPGASPASPALIAAVSSLPVITQPVIIDATTQPGYDDRPVVEVTSQVPLAGTGFDVQADGVTIRGLMITKFTHGILAHTGFNGHVIERNVIGTNRDHLPGLGNTNGVVVNAGATLVQHNVIAGNTNEVMVAMGSGATIANNMIGVGHDGITTLPPGEDGVVVSANASNVAIDNNRIAGNGGWGVNIQNNGTPPINTRLRNNTIGLNANGGALGNGSGGVRNDWGNGTRIGEPGARNIISGNGGPGIWISGNPVNTPLIQNNYIGTDPAGSAERGNATHGITVDGTVAVQIGGASTGEGNVISGNHQHGINVNGAVTAAAVIHGNIIGLNAAGDAMLGNTHSGISASNSALNVGGPSAGMRNVISGNQQGIVFSNSGSTRHSNVSGNYIGTDITGMLDRGNSTGVVVGSAPGTVITGNVISGNSIGVTIDNINAKVEGNIIGLNKDKNGAVPNGTGVHLANNDNLIGGDPNFISGNTGIGIRVASAGVGNWITENAIFNNGGLGIDLDNDGVTANDNGDTDGDADNRGNDAQNFPVLSGATSSSGVLTQVNVDISTFKVGTYVVEFFASATCDASGHGEGQRYVGRRSVVQPGGNFSVNELVPAGEFLTATATDSLRNTSEFGGCVEVDPSIVVSNANDSGSGSLRQAIIDANSTPGQQTISFNIAGVTAATPAVINITSAPLPAITDTVLINGIGQSGYDGLPVIEVRGPNTTSGWSGFEINSVGVSINGLSITRFTHGVFGWQSLTGNVIEMNFIGTNRSYTAGLGNGDGVFWRTSSSAISHNVISGNSTGITLNLGGSSNTIEGNKIGLAHDGVTPVPNGGHGVVLYDGASSNTFINNIISANAGWGVDIQHSGALAPVTDTKFYKNIIGLAANGDLIGVGAPRFEGPTSYGPDVDFGPMQRGNWGGGIHVVNGPGTLIGDPQSGFHNTISGNSGPGILMDVVPGGGPVSKIQNNIIGLDPTGAMARGNGAHGVFSLAPNTRIGGTGPFESNVISANIANGVVAAGDGVSQQIVNNLIGTNHDGTTTTGTDGKPLGNGVLTNPAFGCCKAGVYLTSGNNQVIDNVIAGNQIGVRSSAGAPSLPNLIDHNFIGTNAAGVISAANTKGVFLAGDTVGTHVTRNTIKHSHEDGILVAESSSGARIGGSVAEANLITANDVGIVVGYDATAADIQIAISHNSIHNNAFIGIDLGNDGPTANDGPTMEDFDDGPNRLQNYPTITRVTNEGTDTRVEGVIESAANTTFTLHVYSSSTCDPSGFGEAETFRHAHNQGTNSVGQGFFSFVFPGPLPAGQVVTMTATDPAGNTSELSQCAEVPEQFTVAGTAGGQANLNNPPSGTAPVSTVTLGPNQQVTISATGLVDYGSGTADTGPNGLGVPAPGDNLAPGLTSVSLIGRINGGAWQQIGAGPTLLTAGPAGGVLELALNDSSYDDNQGSWTAYVWKH